MTAPIRVGVVGAGAIAQVAHLPTIARSPDFELAGICDNDQARVRSLSSRFEAPGYDDIEYLLERARPDAVAICTPNHLHEVHVQTALRAGVHVLCERPLALSAHGVERIVKDQERADCVVAVGTQARYRRDVQIVRQFLTGGELGSPHGIRSGWYTHRPPHASPEWRRRVAESGGGSLLDLGLGLIDLALWLLDWPAIRYVTASLTPPPGPRSVEDSGVGTVVCENGVTITVDTSWRYIGAAERLWFEILASAGSASIGPVSVYKELHGAPTDVTPSGLAPRRSTYNVAHAAQWAHFAAQIRGEGDRTDLNEQLIVHRVIEAWYKSAAEGTAAVL